MTIEQKIAMNLVRADRDVGRSAYFRHALEFIPPENATHWIVRITQNEQPCILCNAGTERVPVDRVGPIILAMKRRLHELKVAVFRRGENGWINGRLNQNGTFPKRTARDVQAWHDTRDGNDIVSSNPPLVTMRHTIRHQAGEFMDLSPIVAVQAARVAEDPLIDVCAERAGNRFRRMEVHVRNK